MSAETLRAAATKLREAVESAPEEVRTSGITQGVWLTYPSAPGAFHMTTTPARESALADWLDEEALVIGTRDAADINPRAHAVAVAVLGGSL